ncbi:unnamed protein product [Rotaria socialis]
MDMRRRYRVCCKKSLRIICMTFCIATIAFISIYSHITLSPFGESTKAFIVDENDLEDAKMKPTSNLHLLREDYFNATQLTCRYPTLKIDHPDIWKHLHPVQKSQPDCGKQQNWVYVENGTFRLSKEALDKHGPIECAYYPILRSKDDFSAMEGARLFPFVDKTALISDFFRVDCHGKNGSSYSNLHMGIKFDTLLHLRSIRNSMVNTHIGYNILMFGFDSVSRMTFMRFLPKSYSFIIKELGAVVMKGYNIVGDGTRAALLPLLTGKTQRELPEARRGHADAETVDQFPWIWNQFKDSGYVTQWAEDMQFVGTFQHRLKGFRDPPVDHYGRPFYLFAESKKKSKPFCFGSITRFQAMFNWIRNFFDMYPHQPKFSYIFHADYSHNSNNLIPYADNELLGFLQMIKTHGYLDRTMLIIITDHGSRYSSLRNTYQGKLEERLPFMAIRMPTQFQAQYPMIMRNLRLNSRRLTTMFDLHETFEHLLKFHSLVPYQSQSNRSFSLFELVPENRTCANAGIQPHWCACLNWHDLSINEPIIQQFSQAVVHFLNEFVSDHKRDCATLAVLRVNKASQLNGSGDLLKFVNSNNKRAGTSRFGKKSLQWSNNTKFYQIQLETTPGQGQFEVTAEYDLEKKTFDIHKQHLSRINKYGETSACVTSKRPEFQDICYCSNSIFHKNTTSNIVVTAE